MATYAFQFCMTPHFWHSKSKVCELMWQYLDDLHVTR